MELLQKHARHLGIEIVTVDSMESVRFRYGCRHKCETVKTTRQIFNLRTGDCPMCCDGVQVAMDIVQTQLLEHHLTVDQILELQEDYHTIACLYALTKHVPGTVVSDMIRIWHKQNGSCSKCKCRLYPTLSTRAMHIRKNKLYCEHC